jgi:hypothetical protein
MSCPRCDDVQHLQKQGRQCIYLRIGNAEVLIGACFEHFQELRIAYLRGLNESELPELPDEAPSSSE